MSGHIWRTTNVTLGYPPTTPHLFSTFKNRGEVADILINPDTKFNFYSIINHFDYTYVDQSPLHVLLKQLKNNNNIRKTYAGRISFVVSVVFNIAQQKYN